MEFHYGLWLGVSALYSESGRQLGEENTRPFLLNHHIPAEKIVCKYEGSREGRLINMSALKPAMQNFDAALAITKAVQSYHLARKHSSGPFGVWDLYILSRASIALIAYTVRFRRQVSPKIKVSDALTSQFQFISGVFMICRHMMETGNASIATNQPLAHQTLFNYADEHQIFISFNGMACAGSTKKILEFLEFCNDHSPLTGKSEIALDTIVSEPDNWYEYALACIELDCFVEQERMARMKREANRSTEDDAADIYNAVGDYVRGLMQVHAPADKISSAFEEGALLRQNRILRILGKQSIHRLDPKHIDARLA